MDQIYNDIELKTIPPNTRCHLWNIATQTIGSHFVATGPLVVATLRNHGPMYNYLISKVSDKSIIMQFIDEFKSYFQMSNGHLESALEKFEQDKVGQDIDALLMAVDKKNNRIALLFINPGEQPDIQYLISGVDYPSEMYNQDNFYEDPFDRSAEPLEPQYYQNQMMGDQDLFYDEGPQQDLFNNPDLDM